MSEGLDPDQAIPREENDSPKGPQNIKERLYERLRMPLWLLDIFLVLLCAGLLVALVLGFLEGHKQ